MQLSDVVTTSHTVAATSSRTAKVEALAACLRRAAQDGPDVVEVVTAHLSGTLPQRRIGVSWRGLQGLPDPADTSTLTVEEVDAAATAIAAIGGSGARAARSSAVREPFARAPAAEHEIPDAKIVDVHLQIEQLNLLDRFWQETLQLARPGFAFKHSWREAAGRSRQRHCLQ